MESDDFTRHYIIQCLSARDLVLPPPPPPPHLQSAVVPTVLSELTLYSSPLLCYSQISHTNPCPASFVVPKGLPKLTLSPSFAVVYLQVYHVISLWYVITLHKHTCKAFVQHAHQHLTLARSDLYWRWLDSPTSQTTLLFSACFCK